MLGHGTRGATQGGVVKPLGKRLHYLDNLKVLLTILVILHHVGQAYGPTGGFWQYRSSLNESWPWLGYFFRVNAGFFLGCFFLVSGYFVPASLDRKGARAFMGDRLVRYGVPVLLAALVMVPMCMYFYYSHYSGNPPLGFLEYYTRVYLPLGQRPPGFKESIGWPELNFGHLWFVEHLLVYSGLYALLHGYLPKSTAAGKSRTLGMGNLVAVAAGLSLVTVVVRIWYPIDTWVGILFVIQSEPAHLPQYVTLFCMGVLAYRRGWFQGLGNRTGAQALSLGLAMVLTVYAWPALPTGLTGAISEYWAVYESFMAVFLSWGLVWFLRERANGTNGLMKALSANAYAAYFVHYPIVLAVQYGLDGARIFGAPGKFATVGLVSVALSFGTAMVLRRLTAVKRIL